MVVGNNGKKPAGHSALRGGPRRCGGGGTGAGAGGRDKVQHHQDSGTVQGVLQVQRDAVQDAAGVRHQPAADHHRAGRRQLCHVGARPLLAADDPAHPVAARPRRLLRG